MGGHRHHQRRQHCKTGKTGSITSHFPRLSIHGFDCSSEIFRIQAGGNWQQEVRTKPKPKKVVAQGVNKQMRVSKEPSGKDIGKNKPKR